MGPFAILQIGCEQDVWQYVQDQQLNPKVSSSNAIGQCTFEYVQRRVSEFVAFLTNVVHICVDEARQELSNPTPARSAWRLAAGHGIDA
jgi:hypothetical protein